MEKTLTFTADQKNLIYNRFVQPLNGTKEESDQFIEICETFGLNPLLNDIVFQKYGARVNFITTRDGLLRVATGQPGYVGAPNANVVREGDHFQSKNGVVDHKFGAQRGKIIGAYAEMRHANFNPVAVFVDFEEYYNANSGLKNSRSGKANVWDTMPSAMIMKVAEVFVLRRQFPLGGLYTYEEMHLELEEEPFTSPVVHPNVSDQSNQNLPISHSHGASIGSTGNNIIPSQAQEQDHQLENQGSNTTETLTKEQIDQLLTIIDEIADVRNVPKETIAGALGKPLIDININEFEATKNKLLKWLEQATKEASSTNNQQNQDQSNTEQGNQQQSNPEQTQNQENPTTVNQFVLVRKEEDQSPNGSKIVRVYVQGQENPIFARSIEAIKDISTIKEGSTFIARTEEINGFIFLESIKAENINQIA